MPNEKDQSSSPRRRTISESLAPIIEHLELKGDRIVLLDDLRALRPDVQDRTLRWMAHQLVERGWFAPLAVKGAYEFIPGSAAGRYRSGDPWLNLRAALRVQPNLKVHIGLGSAAWIHGYRDRVPARQLIVSARIPKPPPSLSKEYIVVRTDETNVFGSALKQGLPVATIERIFVEVAWRPDLVDIRSDRDWIAKLAAEIDQQVVTEFLQKLSLNSAWARAGYLAEQLGRSELAHAIEEHMPPLSGPVYWGSAAGRVHYVARWQLYDNAGVHEISGGATVDGN